MIEGIMENYRKDIALTKAEFRKSSFYYECEQIAREVTLVMQNSSVMEDFRAISKFVSEAFKDEELIGPTGHKYLCTTTTFKSAYPNYLISYEFAMLFFDKKQLQATCNAKHEFPEIEVLEHYLFFLLER